MLNSIKPFDIIEGDNSILNPEINFHHLNHTMNENATRKRGHH